MSLAMLTKAVSRMRHNDDLGEWAHVAGQAFLAEVRQTR